MGSLAGLVAMLCTLLLASTASAQQTAKTVTIGYLGNSNPSREASLLKAFREGLRVHGYVEGHNLVLTFQWANGEQDRFDALAKELVRQKPDVILTAGTPAALAAKRVTTSIPIVSAVTGDPVAVGLVATLAKPGGNVTGLSTMAPDLEAKRLELLKQALPKAVRVVALLNPANSFGLVSWKHVQPSAATLGIKLERIDATGPNDLDRALAAVRAARPDALIVIPDRFLLTYRAPILKFVTEQRMPGVFAYREFAEDGGLMAYGPDYTDLFRRAATYVDKIAKGARAGDLPIEQPNRFELVINMKTAKALGVTIPGPLLIRADHVIE